MSVSGGGAEKEGERERFSNRLCSVSAELDAGLGLMNWEIVT